MRTKTVYGTIGGCMHVMSYCWWSRGPQCSLAWTFVRRRPRLRPEIDRHETCGHDGRQIIPGEGAQSDEIYRFRARNEHSAKFSVEAPNRAVSFLERQNKNLCYPNNLYPLIYALTLTSLFHVYHCIG